MLVIRLNPRTCVKQKQTDVGLTDCALGLLPHSFFKIVFRGIFIPGGINNIKSQILQSGLSFAPVAGDTRLHLLTKKARHTYAEARYADGDFLVFGCESVGLPEDLLAGNADRCERIPMLPDAVSLDNARDWGTTDERADHAALLAQDVCGNFVNPEDYRISALNLSNAAAVVLYEALRQTGFEGMETT